MQNISSTSLTRILTLLISESLALLETAKTSYNLLSAIFFQDFTEKGEGTERSTRSSEQGSSCSSFFLIDEIIRCCHCQK